MRGEAGWQGTAIGQNNQLRREPTADRRGRNPRESFDNLIRLGLIATEYELDDSKIKVGLDRSGRRAKVDAKLDSDDYLADFAFRFVHACRPPAVTIEGQATEAK
jgi:hypothetical protein